MMNRIPVTRYLPTLCALFVLVHASGCASIMPRQADQWFRGNTHTHTVLCGHADSSPEAVAAWYHDRGYHFLILSEHNRFIDPKTVTMPANKRDDFILVPGIEVTGKKHIHSTAMNVQRVVPWDFDHADKSAIIQSHVDGTLKEGGQAILNHPNYHYAVSAADMKAVQNLHLFELFNGHPSVNNHGNATQPSTEAMWDEMLTGGMLIYGVSSDDAHHFQIIDPKKSNPGRGWVMVHAATLDPDTITAAMMRGDFYASSGVFLKTCRRGPDAYVVRVDVQRTRKELKASPALRGRHVESGIEGYRIEFIGPDGEVLDSVAGKNGRFGIDASIAYVRAKVTYTRKHPEKQGLEEYYAWGQPVFSDARARGEAPKPGKPDKPDAGP